MLLKDLYKHYGSWPNLEQALEIGTMSYRYWKDKGYIPISAQVMIELKTKGLFKASLEHAGPGRRRKKQPKAVREEFLRRAGTAKI